MYANILSTEKGACNVGVLGGGVVGLSTALELKGLLRNANITLIADKFTTETTSDGAAGIFRPAENFKGPSADIAKEWIDYSYYHYKDLIQNMECGISEISGYIFSNLSRSATRNHFLENLVTVYRDIEEDEKSICPPYWMYGSFSHTLLIECRYYLPWAMRKFISSGGIVVRGKLQSFSDINSFGKFDVFVNCTGLGSRELCDDIDLIPIRGQVFKVEAPWLKQFYFGENDTYIIPGRSGATLGGSRHYGNFKRNLCPHDGAAIWERCVTMVPKLATSRVIREWVGLRPHRDVVRVEKEIIDGKKIVHNYGHGGSGVTSAPGTARTAANMAVDLLKSKAKL